MAVGHELAMTLRRAYLTLHRRADAAVRDLDLTADQFALLTELTAADGAIQRELAGRLGSDANTVAAILRRLEEKGLVRRTSAVGDARSNQVWLTAVGRRSQQEAARRLRSLWARVGGYHAELAEPLARLCDELSAP